MRTSKFCSENCGKMIYIYIYTIQISLNIIDIFCLHIFWYKFHNTAFKEKIHAQQQNYEKFSPKTQQY